MNTVKNWFNCALPRSLIDLNPNPGIPRNRPMGPKRCPVYLRLPWKGPWLLSNRPNNRPCTSANAVNVNCVYTTSRAFNLKEFYRPTVSNLIYQFECRHLPAGTSVEQPNGCLAATSAILVHESPRPKRGRPPANSSTGETYISNIACTVLVTNVMTQTDCACLHR